MPDWSSWNKSNESRQQEHSRRYPTPLRASRPGTGSRPSLQPRPPHHPPITRTECPLATGAHSREDRGRCDAPRAALRQRGFEGGPARLPPVTTHQVRRVDGVHGLTPDARVRVPLERAAPLRLGAAAGRPSTAQPGASGTRSAQSFAGGEGSVNGPACGRKTSATCTTLTWTRATAMSNRTYQLFTMIATPAEKARHLALAQYREGWTECRFTLDPRSAFGGTRTRRQWRRSDRRLSHLPSARRIVPNERGRPAPHAPADPEPPDEVMGIDIQSPIPRDPRLMNCRPEPQPDQVLGAFAAPATNAKGPDTRPGQRPMNTELPARMEP